MKHSKMSTAAFAFVIFCIISIPSSNAVLQKLEIFSEPDGQGMGHVFVSKTATLSNWRFFLDEAKSFCLTGWWYLYSEEGFESHVYTTGEAVTERKCENRNFTDIRSFRFVGPEDTKSQSISIYGEGTSHSKEIVIKAIRQNNFGYVPTGLLISGNTTSQWTVYSGTEYNGTATCLRGSDITDLTYMDMSVVGHDVLSVAKGCEQDLNGGNGGNMNHLGNLLYVTGLVILVSMYFHYKL